MLQKFFTNTAESNFIKSLLYNVNLPILKTISEDDYIVEGNTYIYKQSVVKCIRTGYVMFGSDATLRCSQSVIIHSNSPLVGDNPSMGEYVITSPFVAGELYDSFTQRYISKYSYYDSDTHRYLGKYLRYIRDIYSIDLMPFYNCFNYKIVSDLKLSETGYSAGTDTNYKVLAVPIKFNKKYTVAIDCDSPVIMQSVFYGRFGLIKTNNYQDATYLTEILNETPIKLSSMQFKHPYVYTISSNFGNEADGARKSRDCESFETSLYLLIRLPISNKSSIVVIEGDYSNNAKYVVNMGYFDEFTPTQISNMFRSELSLLQLSDGGIYAFSDRLVEYLLLNVIGSNESIDGNIKYIRDYVYPGASNIGAWDFGLRQTLYNRYMSSNTTQKLDINGFVDKDMEKFITNNYDTTIKANKDWVRGG